MTRKEKPKKKRPVQAKKEEQAKPRKKQMKMKYRHSKIWLEADERD